MNYEAILAIDTESCDGHIDNGSLCSFGYCLADPDFRIVRREDLLINPLPKRFFVGKGGKSGIWFAYPESAFRSAPRLDGVYPQIAELLKGRVLVIGHSLRNDLHYLDNACRLLKLPSLAFDFLDSELLYRLYRDEPCPTGLKSACDYFSLSFTEHRSDEDALASLRLVEGICRARNASLGQLISDWEITLGHYENYSATACFSDRAVGGVPAFVTTSVNSRKMLVLDAQERYLPDSNAPENPFRGKKVWLDSVVKFKDATRTRRIFERLSALGAQLSGIWHCDIAVCTSVSDGDGKPMFKRGVRCLTLDELAEELAPLPQTEYDDVATLRELKRVLFTREQERGRRSLREDCFLNKDEKID